MFNRLIVIVACVAAFAGCATKPSTFAHQDPQVDLHAFKTFAFFEAAPGARARYGTLVGEQVRQATRAQLEKLGYVYDAANPDLRVNIMLAVQQRTEVRSSPVAGPLPYRAWGASKIETAEYREGTLAIDLVDAHRRTMVWRGVAQGRITRKDMEKADQTVRDAVRELFANYPHKG
jgi:hypothetical protein